MAMGKMRRRMLIWWYRFNAQWHIGVVKCFCTPGDWRGWRHICLGQAALDMLDFLENMC